MSDPGEDRAAASSNTGADGASTETRPSAKDLLNAAKAEDKGKSKSTDPGKANSLDYFFGKRETTYVTKGKVKQLVSSKDKAPAPRSATTVTVGKTLLPGDDFKCVHCGALKVILLVYIKRI